MTETKFINGIGVYKPSEKAPEFIVANLSFRKAELIAFLKEMPDEFRANIKESKGGKLYMAVDTYQPKTETPASSDGEAGLSF